MPTHGEGVLHGSSSVGSWNQSLYCEFVDAFYRVDSRCRCQWHAERMVEGTLSLPMPLNAQNDKKKPFCEARDTTALPELLLRSRHNMYHIL